MYNYNYFLQGSRLPNPSRLVPRNKDLLRTLSHLRTNAKRKNMFCAFSFGNDEDGVPILSDLKDMVEVLISGVPGSGKSYTLMHIIRTLLYLNDPSLIDVNVLSLNTDLSVFGGYPGLSFTSDLKDMVKVVLSQDKALKERKTFFEAGEVLNLPTLWEKSYLKNLKTGVVDGDTPHIKILVVDEFQTILSALDMVDRKGHAPKKKSMERLKFLNALESITSTGRASGYYTILSTQNATVSNLSSNLKNNAGCMASFQQSTAVRSGVSGVAGAHQLAKHTGIFRVAEDSQIFKTPKFNYHKIKHFLREIYAG